MEPSYKPVELSFPVPRHLHMNLQVHLTFLGNCSMIHLTTSTIGEGATTHAPLGSFVYAMPDVRVLYSPVLEALAFSHATFSAHLRHHTNYDKLTRRTSDSTPATPSVQLLQQKAQA